VTVSNPLRLYNTLSNDKEVFQPGGPEVKVYVCGITPYDATHLGHAFMAVSFDVLIRYLQFLDHDVRYVQNVTDVDDPLFERAQQLGISYQDLAAGETEQYLADMRGLNVLPPDIYPRASAEIPKMIEIVSDLFETGHAYAVDGHVYFSIATDPGYGKLAKQGRRTMIELARQRGGDPDDPLRHDALDFVLWRPAKPGEPSVESPWGEGLPGWHLECSAMSLKYLGAPLDIHGGGSDLIFPHHENEIAQSEGATGVQPFVRFWIHNGMVYMDGEKMSKSLGNMVFVRDLLPIYGSDAIRLYLSSCHYRADLQYDAAQLQAAAGVAHELTAAATLSPVSASVRLDPNPWRDRFLERMSDDLDTPGSIGILRDLAGAIQTAHREGRDVGQAQHLLRELGGILGLRLQG
jgi:L-cysteine:1D-myo-inositol 2-amino-2-deoxy-alpha-D-glucopyranoside ligase